MNKVVYKASALPWARTAEGRFHRLVSIKPKTLGLSGVSGTYVIWCSGLKVDWVYAGASGDLAESIAAAQNDPKIDKFAEKGGLGVTWVALPAEYRDRVAVFLRAKLKTQVEEELDSVDPKAEPLVVNLPNDPIQKP